MWTLSVNLPNSKFTVLFHECFIKIKIKNLPMELILFLQCLLEVKIKFQVKGMTTKHIRQLIQLTISL